MDPILEKKLRSEMESVETESPLPYIHQRIDTGIRLLDRLYEENGISESFIEDICRHIKIMEDYQVKINTIRNAQAFSGLRHARHYKEKMEVVFDFVFEIIDVCKEHDFRDPIEEHSDYFQDLIRWVHGSAPRPEKPNFKKSGTLATLFDLPHHTDRWKN